MYKELRSFVACAVALGVPSTALAKDTRLAIAKARIETVTNLTTPSTSELSLGGRYRAQVHVLEVLYGRMDSKHIHVDMNIANTPLKPIEVFFLLERQDGGSYRVLVWDYFGGGICIKRDIANHYRIESAVEVLSRKYPCSAYQG